MQKRHLTADPSRAVISTSIDVIPEHERESMRLLHELRPVSELEEQLDSLIPHLPPEERVAAALELIHAWSQGQEEPPSFPDSVQGFYASACTK